MQKSDEKSKNTDFKTIFPIPDYNYILDKAFSITPDIGYTNFQDLIFPS